MLGRLRSDDLYHLLSHYPETAERSTGLAYQAAMLQVILYFVPETLKQETAFMREIVDKVGSKNKIIKDKKYFLQYFCDNWVISTYMGQIVWLPEAWEQYKAAKAAINNTTGNNDIKKLAVYHGNKLRSLIPSLKELLTEGYVTQETLLDNVTKVLTVIRESNVTLRWLVLHTTQLSHGVTQHKKSRQLLELARMEAKVTTEDVLGLIVLVSRLEQHTRNLYSRMLADRARTWTVLRQGCVDRMEELADVFGGKQKLSRIQPNKRLEKWLMERAEQMKSLNLEISPETSSRMAVNLIQALDDAKEFHQLEANLQVQN